VNQAADVAATHRWPRPARAVTQLPVRGVVVLAALAALAALVALGLVACTTSAAPPPAPGSASAPPASSVPAGPGLTGPPTVPAGPVITPWPAPTSSPEIAAAQSEVGSVGKTLLTWATPTSAVGVSIDYITDYQPASGYTVAAGQRAIQIDVRIVNANNQSINASGWSVYADIDNKALAPVKDANYVDITELPPIAANSNGYIPARVLIPSAGGEILIGVTNPSFPHQPATFAVILS
jgi:hypothetical protein